MGSFGAIDDRDDRVRSVHIKDTLLLSPKFTSPRFHGRNHDSVHCTNGTICARRNYGCGLSVHIWSQPWTESFIWSGSSSSSCSSFRFLACIKSDNVGTAMSEQGVMTSAKRQASSVCRGTCGQILIMCNGAPLFVVEPSPPQRFSC